MSHYRSRNARCSGLSALRTSEFEPTTFGLKLLTITTSQPENRAITLKMFPISPNDLIEVRMGVGWDGGCDGGGPGGQNIMSISMSFWIMEVREQQADGGKREEESGSGGVYRCCVDTLACRRV